MPDYVARADARERGGAYISDAFSMSYNDGVSQNIFAGDTLTQEVLCAFDPNEKTVIPKGTGLLHNISSTDTLDYTIHFQNVGNDTAFFVKVIDTLSTWLNPISLQIISASHDYSFTNNNGILTFDFAQCNLSDSSKNYAASCGYVRFKIAQKNANPATTVINNTAHIYFNYNRSISTNTVFNTIATPVNIATQDRDENNQVYIFPNPTHDKVTVIYPNAAHQQCTIVLKNMLGQPIYKTVSNSEKAILSNLNLPTGVYIVEIKCGDKEYIKKLIVD